MLKSMGTTFIVKYFTVDDSNCVNKGSDVRKLDWQQNYSNILELDFSMWKIVQAIGTKPNNRILASIGANAMSFIISATDEELLRLSSGTIISFKMNVDESHVISMLQQSQQITFITADYTANVSTFCWLLVARLGMSDPIMTTQTFGLSLALVTALATATDNDIRKVSLSVDCELCLRFPENLIKKILKCDKANLQNYQFYKFQEVIMNSEAICNRTKVK